MVFEEVLFTVTASLGTGGFGIVRVGVRCVAERRKQPQDFLVVKEIVVSSGTAQPYSGRIKDPWREIDAIKTLNHPHVAKVVASYEVISAGQLWRFGFGILPLGDGNLDRFLKEVPSSGGTNISKCGRSASQTQLPISTVYESGMTASSQAKFFFQRG